MTIELVDTECLRSENFERSKCKPDPANGSFRTCTVNIWDQPWLNSKQIRDPDCEASGSEVESRSLKTTSALGPRENVTLSPEDDDVKIAANFALSRLDAFDDNSKKRVLIKIIEAASHVSKLPCRLFLFFSYSIFFCAQYRVLPGPKRTTSEFKWL